MGMSEKIVEVPRDKYIDARYKIFLDFWNALNKLEEARNKAYSNAVIVRDKALNKAMETFENENK